MSVYVDAAIWRRQKPPFAGGLWCHLSADSLEELHAFALSIGLQRRWFQPLSYPHYDMISWRRDIAIQRGAIPVRSREILAKSKALA